MVGIIEGIVFLSMAVGGGLISMIIFKKLFPVPVSECEVYNEEGCCHIDTRLCDMENCSIRKKHDMRNNK